MSRSYKTEAVVLRSIRFGEADRVLHLYSSTEGRVGAIAKGSRRPRSRFGGRLEPFFRLNLVLYRGRGELSTVTAAETVDGHPRLRESGAGARRRGPGVRRGPAPARLGRGEPRRVPPAVPLPGAADAAEPVSRLEVALAFRLKLALAAGFTPELASCARCGEADGLVGFSGAAGGIVCAACEGGGFELSADAHRFMVEALGSPLSEAPAADPRALRQAERAISETLEHHAHVRLRAAAAA